MLKILIKKQLQEIIQRTLNRRKGKNGKTTSGNGMLVIWAISTIYMMAMFTGLAMMLAEPLFEIQLAWFYYLFLGALAVVLGTVGSVFSTYFTLYLGKDNDLLLSMPVLVRDVIISRLLSVYVMGLVFSGMVCLPAVVVGWIDGGAGIAAILGGIIWVLLISLIVLGLSCLFGWVVARLSQRLKNRSYLTVLISLVLLGVYFVVYFNVMEQMRDVVSTALALGNKIQYSAYPIYLFGRIGEGDGGAILVWAVGVLLVLGLIWILLNKTFMAISTATPVAKRTAYRERSVRQSSVAGALRRREWYRFSSSANYMLNSSMGILFLVAFGVYLLIDAKTVLDAANQILSVHPGTIPVLLCSLICAMGGTIDISAPSVSLEGKTIWLVQSLPATPWQILCAKLELHLLVAVLPTLFCSVCAVVIVPATLAQKLLMVAVTMLFSLFIDVFGLALGIKMPNLSWGNEISPLKQSAAVNITVLGGMGLGVALFGLYYLIGPDKLGATAYLSATTLILLGTDAYLFLWLRRQGARRFAALN